MTGTKKDGLRRIGWGLAATASMALLFAGQPASAVTLKEELHGLYDTHPKLLKAAADREAARYGVFSSRAKFMPKIKLSGDMGYERTNSPSRRDSNQGPYRTHNRQKTTLKLTQSIFSGGANYAGHKSAKLKDEIATIKEDQTTQGILADGITEYLNVLREKRSLRIAQDQEGTLEEQVKLEKGRFDKGSGVKVDVLAAMKRLQRARAQRAHFEGELEVAATAYKEVFDHMPEINRMLPPPAPFARLPKNEEEATGRALRYAHKARIAELDVEVARQAVNKARGKFMPSLDLEAKYERTFNNSAVSDTKYVRSLLFKTSWDLFSGLGNYAGERKARAKYVASQHDETSDRRGVVKKVQTAWKRYETQTARVGHLKEAADTAWEEFQSRVKRREAGKERTLDVLDSELEAREAQIAFIKADVDQQIAAYKLLEAMGELRIEDL